MRIPILIAALAVTGILLAFFPSCVKEGKKDRCVSATLEVSFYAQTPCQSEAAYPEEINDLLVCIFDNDGVLVDYRKIDDVVLTAAYAESFTIDRTGIFYVDVWAGIYDPSLDVSAVTVGKTHRSDLLFMLKRSADVAYPTEGMSVWFGEGPAVYVSQEDIAPVEVSVDMREVTNRVTVTVEGLPQPMENYSVRIESGNGSMTFGGHIAGDEVIQYRPVESNGPDTVYADFTILKLDLDTTTTIVITDTAAGEELFRGSLLGALLLQNPQINLRCDNDFAIRFRARDVYECGTYMITDAWVNDWQVHSYNLDK